MRTQTIQQGGLRHKPVMIEEVVEYLAPQSGEIFLDCTFGAGGYSRRILDSSDCRVVALDRDPDVKIYATELKNKYAERFEFIETNFGGSRQYLSGRKFNGIVMDLGVSSMQLDNGERGFSFTHDGLLDMRMSSRGMSAADFINQADEEEIANVIYRYGDEVASRRIAKKIVSERQIAPILTTAALANIVRSCVRFKKGKIDPATKTFQAIRIYINDELKEIEDFLEIVLDILMQGGRLIIVSFHSLEDKLIKNFFKDHSGKVVARSKYSKIRDVNEEGKPLKILTKKPKIPSRHELSVNPRSRSAKLRAVIKTGDA